MDAATLTLGGIAAGLLAKFLDKSEGKAADAGWAGLGRLAGAIRRHFREHGSDEDQAALARLQEVPDSPSRLEALAQAIDRQVSAEPALANELRGLIEESKAGGIDVGSLAQSAWGDHNVQIAGVVGSAITIHKS